MADIPQYDIDFQNRKKTARGSAAFQTTGVLQCFHNVVWKRSRPVPKVV